MTYGWMTHSFLNSPEHKALKRERALVTAKWQADDRGTIPLPVACTCVYADFPHLTHHDLVHSYNWKTRYNPELGKPFKSRWAR